MNGREPPKRLPEVPAASEKKSWSSRQPCGSIAAVLQPAPEDGSLARLVGPETDLAAIWRRVGPGTRVYVF
jgi:hypothetical protein